MFLRLHQLAAGQDNLTAARDVLMSHYDHTVLLAESQQRGRSIRGPYSDGDGVILFSSQ
ncbi:hypothetical protein NG2371_03518 [Nocardia gamkensis]|nr:hypothetical protein [Nocardia gamkensis]